jgi:hypothetical protein
MYHVRSISRFVSRTWSRHVQHNWLSVRKLGNKSETSQSKPPRSYNFKNVTGSAVALLAMGYIGVTYIDQKQNIGELISDVRKMFLPKAIQHSYSSSIKILTLEESGHYITRPFLEAKINSILNREKATDQYFVVYGPKGVGKSVLVSKCVKDKKGAAKIIISSVFQKKDILQLLWDKVLLLSLKKKW